MTKKGLLCRKQVSKINILKPEDNKKKASNKYIKNTNKYQKHIACSYGYKSVGVDDKFDELFKTYLGKDAAYNFRR